MKDNELNYKEAYLYLFNHVTNLIEEMKKMQQVAESIAISEREDKKLLYSK